MDYVLLSPNDGELLKKAHQMLLEGGVNDDAKWNKYYNPDADKELAQTENRDVWYYALEVIDNGRMSFHNHDCNGEDVIPITITPENITESVATVLNSYNASKQ